MIVKGTLQLFCTVFLLFFGFCKNEEKIATQGQRKFKESTSPFQKVNDKLIKLHSFLIMINIFIISKKKRIFLNCFFKNET